MVIKRYLPGLFSALNSESGTTISASKHAIKNVSTIIFAKPRLSKIICESEAEKIDPINTRTMFKPARYNRIVKIRDFFSSLFSVNVYHRSNAVSIPKRDTANIICQNLSKRSRTPYSLTVK